jgi:hypothetical protein
MYTVSRYSYLLSYTFLPQGYTPDQLDTKLLQLKNNAGLSFRAMSLISLADAVDAVARVWLRDLRRYITWQKQAK